MFHKGDPKKGGRKKGVRNKVNVKFSTIRESVFQTYTELQDDPKYNLRAFARKYPRDFYQIAAKLIPQEIVGKDGKDLLQKVIVEVIESKPPTT